LILVITAPDDHFLYQCANRGLVWFKWARPTGSLVHVHARA
jgi:hypothetical protein